ncbi:hypothetical protein BJ875DRAFT_517787 [Amylocarpus encephaloides]|uniref:Uncharacterized protein n=1 Tax=Amylocarpus encephaloides TaxID=45428 RepID=A0A9P8C2Q2_9HELO|nr:hypothetical protein BJ875DRAFT_517787 [Amylocarpus encephaloides]
MKSKSPPQEARTIGEHQQLSENMSFQNSPQEADLVDNSVASSKNMLSQLSPEEAASKTHRPEGYNTSIETLEKMIRTKTILKHSTAVGENLKEHTTAVGENLKEHAIALGESMKTVFMEALNSTANTLLVALLDKTSPNSYILPAAAMTPKDNEDEAGYHDEPHQSGSPDLVEINQPASKRRADNCDSSRSKRKFEEQEKDFEIQELSYQQSRIKQKLDECKALYANIDQKMRKSAEGIQELEERNAKLRDQNQKLRDMVLKGNVANSEPIDDTTITALFNKLRDQIQRIVMKNHLVDPEVRPRLTANALRFQQKFAALWEQGLDLDQLRKRTQCLIFGVLRRAILSRECFGLRTAEFSSVETCLMQFESALVAKKNGHEIEIAEWRVRTIKLASLLNQNKLDIRVVDHVYDSLIPLFSALPGWQGAEETSHAFCLQLSEMCETAAKLAVTLRASKDSYCFEAPNAGSKADWDEMNILGYEASGGGDIKDKDGAITFCICESLVKYPEHDPHERLVLEKAHVVVRRG